MKDRKKIIKIAKSVFSQAVKENSVKKTGINLKFMSRLLRENPDILHFFNDIFQSSGRHRAVLKELAQKAGFNKLSQNYFLYLLELRSMGSVSRVYEHYRRLSDAYLGQERAVVITPTPMKLEKRTALGKALSRMTGKKIILREHIDPSLIAGVSVRIGSTIFDGSVSNQLQRIKKEICNAS